jgi:hypothetical protein
LEVNGLINNREKHEVDYYTSGQLAMMNRIGMLLQRGDLDGFIVRSKVPFITEHLVMNLITTLSEEQ